jgi:hypothetical protein
MSTGFIPSGASKTRNVCPEAQKYDCFMALELLLVGTGGSARHGGIPETQEQPFTLYLSRRAEIEPNRVPLRLRLPGAIWLELGLLLFWLVERKWWSRMQPDADKQPVNRRLPPMTSASFRFKDDFEPDCCLRL